MDARKVARRAAILAGVAAAITTAPVLAQWAPDVDDGPRLPVWARAGQAERIEEVMGSTADGSGLDAYILARMASAHMPGLTACVVHGDRIVWARAYGLADVQRKVDLTVDTPILWASVSKPVAATALMQLHDAGLFDLEAPANDVLPFDLEHPQYPTDVITPRHLLSHTASANDNWDVLLPLISEGDSPIAMSTFFPGYFTTGGAWYEPFGSYLAGTHPGDQYTYSNAGYAVGASLVEPLSGQDFADYCAENLFTPLGMANTGWFLADVADAAILHDWDDIFGGWLAYVPDGWPAYPSAMLRTTPSHLARFLMAHMNGGRFDGVPVVSRLASARMQSVVTPPGSPIDYGLGMYRIPLDNGGLIGHDGRWFGSRSYMLYRPADDVGVLMATNGHLETTQQFVDFDLILLRLLEEFRQTCPGDANRSGAVGVDDLLEVLALWGPCDSCPQDVDHDGVIGVAELLATLAGWGPCPIVRDSGPFGPIGFGSSQAYDFNVLPPAADDVVFTIETVADLGDPTAHLVIRLNGTTLATLFGATGHDCPEEPDLASFVVPAATFNDLLGSGALVSIKSPGDSDPAGCDGFSYVRVRVEYTPQ